MGRSVKFAHDLHRLKRESAARVPMEASFVRSTFDEAHRDFSEFLVLDVGGDSAHAEALASPRRACGSV